MKAVRRSMYVFYFVTDAGRSPVKEFSDDLNIHSYRKFVRTIELLEVSGTRLRCPHVKYIGDSIFELRFECFEGSARVLYFFFNKDTAVLTNGFIKKSNKIPKNEKLLAINRRQIYLQQHQ
jgi:phage-related protein